MTACAGDARGHSLRVVDAHSVDNARVLDPARFVEGARATRALCTASSSSFGGVGEMPPP